MMPDNVLSTEPRAAGFLPPRDRHRQPLIDYDYGGIALQDPSQGLQVQVWRCRYEGGDFILDAPTVAPTVVFSEPGVRELGMTFDQAMNVFLCWVRADGTAAYRWFDPTVPGFVVVPLPSGTLSPRCALDDKRAAAGTIAGVSDIILGYVRDGKLYHRRQRDRFEVELGLADVAGKTLDQVGMNRIGRMQFRLLGGPTPSVALASIGRTVAHIASLAGVDAVDTSEIEDRHVEGYVLTRETTARAAIEPLRTVGLFDLAERGATIRFPARGKAPVAVLEEDELGARLAGDEDAPAVTTTKIQDYELPARLRIQYLSSARDYEPDHQPSSTRFGTRSTNEVTVSVPVTLSTEQAADVAEVMFRESWASRWSHAFTVGPRRHALEPCDVVLLPVDGRLRRVRLVTINDRSLLVRAMQCVRDDDGAYVSVAVAAPPIKAPSTVRLLGDSEVTFLDLPALRDEDDNAGVYVTAHRAGIGATWSGARLHRSLDGGVTYAMLAALGPGAVIGEVVAAPSSGDTYTWDDRAEYVVKLKVGALESRTDAAVLAGANGAAVGAHGRWCIFQFGRATLIGPATYRLSRLLLGRRGTEHLIDQVQPGDRFVLLSGPGVHRLPLQTAEIGAERLYRPVTLGAPFDSGVDVSFASTGQALKPFSPVHVAGTRDGGGDLTIIWTRRDRLGQELPDGVELPLSEAAELYDVEVLDGMGAVVRTFADLSSPSVVYSSADQTMDFGAPQAAVDVRIYQKSAVVGRGTPAEATV